MWRVKPGSDVSELEPVIRRVRDGDGNIILVVVSVDCFFFVERLCVIGK
jgi:hypothetical protein